MLDGPVRARELGEVVADHLGLDFDRVEDFAVVDTDDGTDHLGDDDHVTQVGLDDGGLLIGGSFLLGFAELLDETHGLALETALETTAGAGVDELEVQDKEGKEGKGEDCELLGVFEGFERRG